ncbi:TRAF3-interacting protein 1 isoform X3 [Canis lupus dingo]|uniref:TRAF3-interacting protein 1 isoform X3 n=1 Tax=Canis lupus dingo TaxID=286419 RepID=UPI0020C3E27E|nr:TRAF3-interacting protein 1 isoform X3 [Canis lupus dingo]
MNAAVVRRTQEALGKVIRRPPLTEKLLSKPPFRYLHDIITEVIRMTGFMKGLYTDAEMKSDNVKDKDAKISFLQKAIDVVVMVSGEPLSAKPVRIVAGHEPERTNELLQRIGKCCLSKLPSDEAVKRVLAGERSDLKGRTSLTSKSQELDNKNAREEEPGVHKDKEDKRNSEINERSTSRDGKQKEVKEESKAREKDKEKEKTKESDHDRHKDPERDKHREGERERARSRAKQDRDRGNRDRDRDPDRDRERRNEGGKEKEKWKDRERERERDKARDRDRDRRKVKDGEHSREPDREKSREPDKPEKKSSSSGEMSKKLSDGSVKDSKVEAETEISARASRSVTTKASKRRSKNSMEGRRDSRTSENSLSLEHNSSYSKAKKEHAVKQLDPIVSGLNNEADQETMSSEIGTKEANTSAASVSDDNSAGLWRQSLEPEPAVKQKGAWSGNVIPGPLLSTTHASSGPVSTGLWEAPVFHTRDSPSDAEGEVGLPGPEKSEVSESSELPSELPANIRRIPRPGSARPAPPRVKRQDSVEALTPDRTGSGKIVASVIVDTQNSDNEEDDQFVVEAAPPLPEMSELEMVPAVDVEDEEKHGGLVKKILETKKDYEKLQRSPRPGEKEKLLVFESAWKKEKDIVSKEIEKLRVSIQTLCKSALPLGKIMDYIQEDVDAMQNELQLWHNENKQHAEALQKEQSITDCAVEPLKAELAELEQLIKDQQDKICAVKANVLKNEEKIQRMVYSINLSSRR